MKCFVRQDRVSQIQNLSSEKYIIWTMLAWRIMFTSGQKIYHLNNVGLKNNVHKWSENIIWTMLAWRTLDLRMNLEGHLWMKLEWHLNEWSLRDTCEWSLTYSAVNTCQTTWLGHQLICSQTACWPVLRSNEAQEYWHTSTNGLCSKIHPGDPKGLSPGTFPASQLLWIEGWAWPASTLHSSVCQGRLASTKESQKVMDKWHWII
jgi:hypothetical protein